MITNWKNNKAPEAPYYAVIFISIKGDNLEGYDELDDYLMEKAQNWEGYLGYSVVRNEGKSMFISYWRDKETVESWKAYDIHLDAKAQAPKGDWFKYYHSLVCKVESSSIFEKELRG